MLNLGRGDYGGNKIGDGFVALASALPPITTLGLNCSRVTDEGVASLLANTKVCKSIEILYLIGNQITDVGCAKVVAALSGGALPAIEELYYKEEDADVISEHASDEACAAVDAALQKRLDAKHAE